MAESASLILSTKSLTNPAVFGPPVGGITTKNSFVFNNIDLKNVMGEMWDKYDQFALKLQSISTAGTVTVSGSQNGIVCYNMAGLEWSNVIYETTGSNNINQWVAVAFTVPAQNTIFQTNTGQSFNFKKGNRNVNLQFALSVPETTSQNGFGGFPSQPSTANIYNDVAFQFVIEPVIEGKQNECAYYGFNSNVSITGLNRIVSSDRKEYSYSAFNIRKLCNLFWDKHENFEIQFIGNILRGGGTLSGDVRLALIQMSGLNFVNNQTKNSNNTDKIVFSTESTILGGLVLGANSASHSTNIFDAYAPVQFLKTSDTVPLKLEFRNAENTGVNTASFTGAVPQIQLGFFIKPIYDVEKGTLYLSPWGLLTTPTNAGIINSTGTSFTLKNINLKAVCKTFWDKYEKFNIFLTGMSSVSNAGNTTNPAFILQISGLNFRNQTSYITSAGQTDTATFGTVELPSGVAVGTNALHSSQITTFYKGTEIVDITLDALTLSGSAFSGHSPLFSNFTFTILGCKE